MTLGCLQESLEGDGQELGGAGWGQAAAGRELAWLYLGLSASLQEAARRAQELEMEMLSSTSPPERTRYSPIPPSHHQLTLPDPSHHALHSTPDSPARPEKNGHAKDHPKIAKIFEIQSMPNGKTRTSLKTMSRRKLSQQKEKKATQMLAIVLGEWAPAAGHRPSLASPG